MKKSQRETPDPAIEAFESTVNEIESLALAIISAAGIPVKGREVSWKEADNRLEEVKASGEIDALPHALLLVSDIERLREVIAEEGFTAFVALRALEIGGDAEQMSSIAAGNRRGPYSIDEKGLEVMWREQERIWRETKKPSDKPTIEWARVNTPRKDGGKGVQTRGPVRNALIESGLYPLKPLSN